MASAWKLVLAAAALAAPPLVGAEEGARAQLRLGGEIRASVGAGGVPLAAVGWRARGVWGAKAALRVEGGIDMVIHHLDGGPRSSEGFLIAGAGASITLHPRATCFGLAVAGMHMLDTDEPGGVGYQQHALPALGARIGAEMTPAPNLRNARVGLAVTVIDDLRREHDFFLGEDVGGFTVLVTALVGVEFGTLVGGP